MLCLWCVITTIHANGSLNDLFTLPVPACDLNIVHRKVYGELNQRDVRIFNFKVQRCLFRLTILQSLLDTMRILFLLVLIMIPRVIESLQCCVGEDFPEGEKPIDSVKVISGNKDLFIQCNLMCF